MKTLDEGEVGGIGCPQLIGFCWTDAKIQGLVLHLELGKEEESRAACSDVTTAHEDLTKWKIC